MDDKPSQDNPAPDLSPTERRPDRPKEDSAESGGAPLGAFNKIDLSQLQGFSFGTQWTQDKSAPSEGRDRPEPRRFRDGPGEGPGDRRDRRAFRRPEGPAEGGAAARREGERPSAGGRGAEAQGGPARRPGAFSHGAYQDRVPYDSPYFSVTFYPEDTSFNALVKTIRASCRTIELFEIARTVVAKPDRFTVLVTRRDPSAGRIPTPGRVEAAAPAAGEPATGGEEGRSPAAKPEAAPRPPLAISVPDGLPFDGEEDALEHVLGRHLSLFFDLSEVEVEPPKGNFPVINRCGVTGALLGPPNYHRYSQLVQQHYAAKGLRMPFEAYRARIESVRDPEVLKQWLDQMRKVTRYTWKDSPPPAKKKAAEPAASAEAAVQLPEGTPPEEAAAPAPVSFDSSRRRASFSWLRGASGSCEPRLTRASTDASWKQCRPEKSGGRSKARSNASAASPLTPPTRCAAASGASTSRSSRRARRESPMSAR